MSTVAVAFALVIAVVCAPTRAAAISLGLLDDFSDGTTEGWRSGPLNPNPPTNLDGTLRIVSTGDFGAGGKPTVYNLLQWTGDYLAAGVTAIEADFVNAGSSDLALRLQLSGVGGPFLSVDPILLPAGGELHASFGLSPADFGVIAATLPSFQATLGGVFQLWLFHNPEPLFPGPPVATDLRMDDVTAVPEPCAGALTALALAALLQLARLRAGKAVDASAKRAQRGAAAPSRRPGFAGPSRTD